MQHARPPACKARRVLAEVRAAPAGLDAEHLHAGVGEKVVEQPDGVAAAAHAGHQIIGQPPRLRQNLGTRLAADHAMELAHHHRVGMRAEHRAQQIMRVRDVRHPVAHGFVDGVLQSL